MFRALTQYPSLERLLDLQVPTLVVIGDRDPLMPSPARIQEIASQTDNHVLLVVIEGAAHAINFSHPGELAHVIRLFMADEPIVDDPSSPGRARAYEIHRGARLSHRDAQDRGPRQWRRVLSNNMKAPADPASRASRPRRHPRSPMRSPPETKPTPVRNRIVAQVPAETALPKSAPNAKAMAKTSRAGRPPTRRVLSSAYGPEEQAEKSLALAPGCR